MPRFSSRAAQVPCPEEDLFIELVRSADVLARAPARLLRAEELSPAQYNVLRILRGAPEGLLCGEIAARMISRDPDVTRLVERLRKRGLVSRCRETSDRRRVLVRIAWPGLALLARLDGPVRQLHREQFGHMGSRQLHELQQLLRICRERPIPEQG